ncbi:MAG: ATP-dependent DNA helicase RecG, partial [Gaiellaceae bacterium]
MALEKHLDLHTLDDLLRHYPRRWPKRGDLTPLRELRRGEFVTIYARIDAAHSRQIRPGLKKTDVVVTDGVSKLTLTFFNLKVFQIPQFAPGRSAFFAGKVEMFKGKLQLTHPEYEFIDEFEGIDTGFASAIVPIYPATKSTSTMMIRRAVDAALAIVDLPEDPVPAPIREKLGLAGLAEALEGIHRPTSYEQLGAARKRLAFDEAFVLQVVMAQRRAVAIGLPATPRRPTKGGLLDEFDARLAFELTAGQQEVGETIAREIALEHPMHRLLQGEVGSGKTVVALRAMLAVVDSGGQAALLAP